MNIMELSSFVVDVLKLALLLWYLCFLCRNIWIDSVYCVLLMVCRGGDVVVK